MKHAVDVIVIGLGAMGSAAAMHLAEQGYSTRGFDSFSPPHKLGSSHGESRIFRQAYFEDVRYVPLLIRAYDLWKKLEHDVDEHLLHLTGALVLGPSNGELVARSLASAEEFNLPHQLLDSTELRRRYPVFAIRDNTIALLEQNAGYLVPEACIAQQLRIAARNGAFLHVNEPVLEWKADPGDAGVTVRTAQGEYSAGRLIVTAGPWAPRVLSDLGLPLRVTRQVLYWFEPKKGIDPFRAQNLPVYLLEASGKQPLLYGFPLIGNDSEGVKVALHGSDEYCTPDDVSRQIRPEEEQRMRERLREVMPALEGRLLRAEACLYTMTPDEHFILGPHPEYPSVTLAAGFSGHGFKFSSVMGEILAGLATKGSTQHDLSLFAPDRTFA